MIGSALGLAARQACSLHFGADFSLRMARDTYIDRHIRPIGRFVSIELDATGRSARAAFLSAFSASAVYRDGYGCVLEHGEHIAALVPYLEGEIREEAVNVEVRNEYFDVESLNAAVADSFREPSDASPRQTMAVVVLKNGQLVAEKYAPEIEQATPLPGFSMAKSMTATMIGLLVQHRGLDVMAVVPGAGKLTEAGVTYDQLLRMTSGIGVDENGSGRDANSVMLTQTNDAAGYASSRTQFDSPGASYAYTGGGSVVLSRSFIDVAGEGNPSAAYRFLAERLLKPLDMNSVVLETDGTGTFLGSSFMLATALDWSKLGQLYLQNGKWNNEQILPEHWSEYVSEKTPQSGERDYGAGFWVAVDGGRDSQHEHLPRPPKDAYFMHGMMNQAVYVLPSQSLVITRLGATRSYLESGEWELVADVVSALKPDSYGTKAVLDH